MFAARVGALLSALAFSLSASAAPTSPSFAAVHPNELEVYNPSITAPAAGDVWAVGSQQVVKWDVSQIGDQGRNTTASIYLGHQFADGSEYLDIAHPLVSDAPVTDGQANVTVPDVASGDDYIVVLIGFVSDSGNSSPLFTIQNDNSTSTASASATPASSSGSSVLSTSAVDTVSSAATTSVDTVSSAATASVDTASSAATTSVLLATTESAVSATASAVSTTESAVSTTSA